MHLCETWTYRHYSPLYLTLFVPLGALGLLGNLFIVCVWGRERYHPLRFLFVALAVAHSVALLARHVLSFTPTLPPLCMFLVVPIYASAYMSLLMTIVHYFWVSLRVRVPCFSRRRLLLMLLVLVLWSVLLRLCEMAFNSLMKQSHDRKVIGFSFMGMCLPYLLQLLVLYFLLAKYRAQSRQVAAVQQQQQQEEASVKTGEVRVGSISLHKDSHQRLAGSRQSSDYMIQPGQPVWNAWPEYHLIIADTVVSALSLLLLVLPYLGNYFVNVWHSAESLPAQKAAAKDVLDVTSTVFYSCQPALLLALFPDFRRPFRRLAHLLGCTPSSRSRSSRTTGSSGVAGHSSKPTLVKSDSPTSFVRDLQSSYSLTLVRGAKDHEGGGRSGGH